MKRVEIVPSILSADFTRLGEAVREAEAGGADRIQVDVMDGHFVPNISLGAEIFRAVRGVTGLTLEAHLMIERPERHLHAFIAAGADLILLQVESTNSLYRAVHQVREAGRRAGVVLNPATPVESLRDILPYVSQVLVMTVEPGFGGQQFVETSPDKIRRVRELAPGVDLEVDGGIDARTARLVVEAGANVLVAGSSVYHHPQGPAAGIAALRKAIGERSG